MCRRVLYWYQLYLNNPGGSRLENTIWHVFYYKGFVIQSQLSVKTCKKFQQFKKRKTIYGQLPPKIISALKP